jgi:hypothetical protein
MDVGEKMFRDDEKDAVLHWQLIPSITGIALQKKWFSFSY